MPQRSRQFQAEMLALNQDRRRFCRFIQIMAVMKGQVRVRREKYDRRTVRCSHE
jgi:hypothetical protein